MLEQVVRQDKEDFEAHLYLGGVYHQMKRHGDAARVLTRATELQPESAQARFNLGIAREQSGDLNGAQTAYQQAILLQEDYPVAHEALERVEARLNGPSVLPETVEANSVETTLAEAELGTFAVEDKPAFTKPVRSSFGSAAPASSTSSASTPPASPSTPEFTPTSSATSAFLRTMRRENPAHHLRPRQRQEGPPAMKHPPRSRIFLRSLRRMRLYRRQSPTLMRPATARIRMRLLRPAMDRRMRNLGTARCPFPVSRPRMDSLRSMDRHQAMGRPRRPARRLPMGSLPMARDTHRPVSTAMAARSIMW